MIAIYYRKFRPEEDAFTPVKRHEDADFDLFASQDTLIPSKQVIGVTTNIAIEFPANYEGKIEDKSGLAIKHGLHTIGGVIDHGYTGEIIVIMSNLGPTSVVLKAGQKIAQLKIRERSPWFEFKEVQRPLRESERQDGGFGSTGA